MRTGVKFRTSLARLGWRRSAASSRSPPGSSRSAWWLRDLRDAGRRSPAARAALRHPRRPRVALRRDLRRGGADPRARAGHHPARQAACGGSRFQRRRRRRRLPGGGAPRRARPPAPGRARQARAARHAGREPLPAPAQRAEGQGGGLPGRALGGRRRAGRRLRDAVRHPAGRRVLSGAFDIRQSPLAAYLPSVTPIKPSAVDLVDADGKVIASSRDAQAKSVPPVKLVAGQAEDRTATYRGESFRISERAVAGTPWRMVVTVPVEEACTPRCPPPAGGSRGPGS